MDLSIIIVNWNSKDYLRNCVASVLAETRDLEFEIIVIDSASFDGAGQMLSREFPQVRFIQSQENLGFAKANNLAFKSSTGEMVLFLNPDTEIVAGAVNGLYAALKSLPNAGAVGGRLLNTDGTVQTSSIQAFPTIVNQMLSTELLRRKFPRSKLWGIRPLFEASKQPQVVDGISGACVMLPRALLEKIGVFSEDYFMYAEDMDLCYKVAETGCRCFYVPTATVVHHGGGSSQVAPSNFSSVMMRESAWRYFNKTRGRSYGAIYRLSALVSAFVRLAMLVILFPVRLAQRHRAAWQASFSKWNAILAWSLRRETRGTHL